MGIGLSAWALLCGTGIWGHASLPSLMKYDDYDDKVWEVWKGEGVAGWREGRFFSLLFSWQVGSLVGSWGRDIAAHGPGLESESVLIQQGPVQVLWDGGVIVGQFGFFFFFSPLFSLFSSLLVSCYSVLFSRLFVSPHSAGVHMGTTGLAWHSSWSCRRHKG